MQIIFYSPFPFPLTPNGMWECLIATNTTFNTVDLRPLLEGLTKALSQSTNWYRQKSHNPLIPQIPRSQGKILKTISKTIRRGVLNAQLIVVNTNLLRHMAIRATRMTHRQTWLLNFNFHSREVGRMEKSEPSYPNPKGSDD